MTIHGVSHVALNVTDLRQAEAYYAVLLGLDVAFREAPTEAGWATLPAGAGWGDAERVGVSLEMVALGGDGFALALERADSVSTGSALSHVGLLVDEADLQRWRGVAPELGCDVLTDRAELLVVRDRYGVQWELSATGMASSGERAGRWLDVAAEHGIGSGATEDPEVS